MLQDCVDADEEGVPFCCELPMQVSGVVSSARFNQESVVVTDYFYCPCCGRIKGETTVVDDPEVYREM